MSLTMRMKTGDKPRVVRIGDNITLTIEKVGENRLNLSIDAPRDVKIHRDQAPETNDSSGY